ncbi:MAG: hypothetical protein U0168_21850 [Nannocystaceae bacterium]
MGSGQSPPGSSQPQPPSSLTAAVVAGAAVVHAAAAVVAGHVAAVAVVVAVILTTGIAHAVVVDVTAIVRSGNLGSQPSSAAAATTRDARTLAARIQYRFVITPPRCPRDLDCGGDPFAARVVIVAREVLAAIRGELTLAFHGQPMGSKQHGSRAGRNALLTHRIGRRQQVLAGSKQHGSSGTCGSQHGVPCWAAAQQLLCGA